MPSFEEQYYDVLKSIELAIVGAYTHQTEAKDRHVEAALNGLTRIYSAALKNKRPPNLKLNSVERVFFDGIKTAMEGHMSGEPAYSVDEVVACLKRINRSVEQMMKVGGLGGTKYLEFVRDYQQKTGGR